MEPSLYRVSDKHVSDVSVRRYLSESAEREVLQRLNEQLCHQKRVTTDDVRLAVRTVASARGTTTIPSDFPPSRWVLEFKRLHGFVQPNSFTFDATVGRRGGSAGFSLPKRLERTSLRPVQAQLESRPRPLINHDRHHSIYTSRCSSNMKNGHSSRIAEAQGLSSSDGEEKEEERGRKGSSGSLLPLLSETAVTYSGPRSPVNQEVQQQQQQCRTLVADGCQAAVNGWHLPMRESVATLDERRHRLSWDDLSSDRGSTSTMSYRLNGDYADVGPRSGNDENLMLPHIRPGCSESGRSVDDMQDMASNASSSYNGKRNYKLSHTVPAKTWEKAIAAVEQRGMSLRAAARMYGVHFAALHRRVKKRAQGGHANGNDRYFHPSDEAGIMRVVVAHAELGVLMTFDELMRLVEAAALRKLPDISVKSARKLLTRFQSRNAQSIRHIIDDWPPPQPAVDPIEGIQSQPQPYLEHPGFTFASESAPAMLSSVATASSTGAHNGDAAPAAAAAAATITTTTGATKPALLVSPGRHPVLSRRHELSLNNGRLPALDHPNSALSVAPNDRMRFVSPRTRSPGDNDPVLVV
uniref:HTH psq-type domain-containing protein n=1 Tax=Peronospora matthiolae TaxID=2874970 RepID=A0AAV1VCW6_9STRA